MDLATLDIDARSADPDTGFRAVVALRRFADTLEQQNVARARRLGWSWERIGEGLGITRQAAHKKYRRLR